MSYLVSLDRVIPVVEKALATQEEELSLADILDRLEEYDRQGYYVYPEVCEVKYISFPTWIVEPTIDSSPSLYIETKYEEHRIVVHQLRRDQDLRNYINNLLLSVMSMPKIEVKKTDSKYIGGIVSKTYYIEITYPVWVSPAEYGKHHGIDWQSPIYEFREDTEQFIPTIMVRYSCRDGSSREKYEKRVKEVIDGVGAFMRELHNALWDELEYIKYTARLRLVGKIEEYIYSYYGNISQYIHVQTTPRKSEWSITILCPTAVKGYLIGRGGRTVKKLQQDLLEKFNVKARIKVWDDETLSKKYVSEKGEELDLGRLPDGAVQLITKAVPLIKILKDRYGIYPEMLSKWLEQLERGEEVGEDEGY